MREGYKLDEEHRGRIRACLRRSMGPRFVPGHILAVSDIPYTRNGKKMELAVARILAGHRGEEFSSSMANPECLGEYRSLGVG